MPYIYRNKPDESSGPIPGTTVRENASPTFYDERSPWKTDTTGTESPNSFSDPMPGELKRMQEQWGALSAENFASAAESLPV